MHNRKLRLIKITLGLIVSMTGGVSQAIEPNDPYYKSSINLGPNILPIYYQWSLPALKLEQAWDFARGHSYLAIIDNGIDIDHPDLLGNFRPQFAYDFSTIDEDGVIGDSNVDELIGEDSIAGGHGTHVAGIIAADTNNGIGTTGVCWHCSLIVTKRGGNRTDTVNIDADGINWAVNNGAQAINMSFGNTVQHFLTDSENTCDTLPSSYWDINALDDQKAAAKYCDALEYADEFDIVIVAASGNGVRTIDSEIHYPASDPRTIAVGAIDINGNASPEPDSIAINYEIPQNFAPRAEVTFNFGPEKDLVAPGFNILSTFYNGAFWNDRWENENVYFHPECADYIGAGTTATPVNENWEPQDINSYIVGPRPGGDGYGPCSGTSMAAPHVTGLVGILRSINPLLKKDQIKAALIKHASVDDNVDPDPDPNVYGHGIPDALASVQEALGTSNGNQLNNRLTPLFSLVSADGQDYFNTTSPQMAMAAMYGAMQPQPPTGQVNWHSTGTTIIGYKNFPKPGFWWSEKPRANVYILTTHNDPFNEGRTIVPLYRLSIQRQHGSNNLNVDHTYTTDQAGIDAYKDDHYKLDGIEGYIFSRTETPPPGTVKLYRKYNPTRGDNAIFPESMLSYMASQGYTQNSGDGNGWIGYVYPNVDSDWDGVINGFEDILGTDSSDSDSDNDGISDGIEVNNYPYGDPRDPNS